MRSVADRNVVMRRMTIVLQSVLCSQNVFDMHAQMFRTVSSTVFLSLSVCTEAHSISTAVH